MESVCEEETKNNFLIVLMDSWKTLWFLPMPRLIDPLYHFHSPCGYLWVSDTIHKVMIFKIKDFALLFHNMCKFRTYNSHSHVGMCWTGQTCSYVNKWYDSNKQNEQNELYIKETLDTRLNVLWSINNLQTKRRRLNLISNKSCSYYSCQ